jgi:hypothetical protein
MMKRELVAGGVYAICLAVAVDSHGAPSPAVQPWTGQVQCKIEAGGTAARTETQTWTLTGGAPTQQGAFTMYPATWSATGTGNGLRGAWTLDAPAQPTVITVFVRASDQRLIFKQGAPPASVNGALKTAKAGIPLSANEWNFGTLEAEPSATRVGGSRQGQATALPAVLGAGSTAMQCDWSFSTEGLATSQSASTSGEPAQLQIQRPADASSVLQRTGAPPQSASSTPPASGPKVLNTAPITGTGRGVQTTDAVLNVPLNLTDLNPMIAGLRVLCEMWSTGLPKQGGTGGTDVTVVGSQYIGTVTVRMPTNATAGTSMTYTCSLRPLDATGNYISNANLQYSPVTAGFTW